MQNQLTLCTMDSQPICHGQEFVELVRANAMLPAVAYARKHLAPFATTHLPELQQVDPYH